MEVEVSFSAPSPILLVMRSLFFPRHKTATLPQTVSFVVMALVIVGIEITATDSGLNLLVSRQFAPTLFLLAVFLLAIRWTAFEFVFVVGFLLFVSLDLLTGQGMIGFGLYLILILWFVRSWIIPAGLVLILSETLLIVMSDVPELQIVSSLLVGGTVLAVGLALRYYSERKISAEKETEEAILARDQVRQELASQLHDTIAKDTAHVLLLAQDFAGRHPELSNEITPIVTAASSASRTIRPMIMSLGGDKDPVALQDVIDQVTAMLKTRHIALAVTQDEEITKALPQPQESTAALAIRECGTNILKYAPANSDADLTVDIDDGTGTLSLSMTNVVSEETPVEGVTGGYGLKNLQTRLRYEGGDMELARLVNRWLVYITIPAARKENPVGSTVHG